MSTNGEASKIKHFFLFLINAIKPLRYISALDPFTPLYPPRCIETAHALILKAWLVMRAGTSMFRRILRFGRSRQQAGQSRRAWRGPTQIHNTIILLYTYVLAHSTQHTAHSVKLLPVAHPWLGIGRESAEQAIALV